VLSFTARHAGHSTISGGWRFLFPLNGTTLGHNKRIFWHLKFHGGKHLDSGFLGLNVDAICPSEALVTTYQTICLKPENQKDISIFAFPNLPISAVLRNC
jgi:hypothetical protein